MKLNQEIEKIEKGCGKEFDLINYGYVKCGGFYYNIQRDNTIVLCSTCKTNLSILKKGADLRLEDVKGIIKKSKECPDCPRDYKCVQIKPLLNKLGEMEKGK